MHTCTDIYFYVKCNMGPEANVLHSLERVYTRETQAVWVKALQAM